MSASLNVKTNFTAGRISESLFGRGDLVSYENGARTLDNVVIHPTGGVSRRPGLRHVDEVSKPSRLIPFEFNTEQGYLICLSDKLLRVYRADEVVAELEAPWEAGHLPDINWTQSADTLLIVHPDVSPRKIIRSAAEQWTIEEWEYYRETDGMIRCPYFNFYQRRESITTSTASAGVAKIVSPGKIFSAGHVGSLIKVNNGLLKITAFVNSGEVTAGILKAPSYGSTADWEESAFSNARGWPVSITFHQDRLVVGGSKSLPNRLWLSKSSDLFNFNLGNGLDDDSIEFSILSDQVNAIKSLVSSRHLLVFTTGAEWMVTGEPLAPASIQLKRQTNVGNYGRRNLPPQQVDGATVFISKNGKQLREFLYTDSEQAYLATDLTLMSEDILNSPADIAFDGGRNILYVVLEDGTVSCLTSYRTEQVNAWSRLVTDGKFLSVCVKGDDVYFCIRRGERYFIETFDNGCFADNAVALSSEAPVKAWEVPEYLEGRRVSVVADGLYAGEHIVENGTLELINPAENVIVGLPYEHRIEPLPFMEAGERPYPPKAYRIVSSIFRILKAHSLYIDVGNGYFSAPLFRLNRESPARDKNGYSGDVRLSSIGWKRDMSLPMWSIRSDSPMPFTLLSVVNEIRTK